MSVSTFMTFRKTVLYVRHIWAFLAKNWSSNTNIPKLTSALVINGTCLYRLIYICLGINCEQRITASGGGPVFFKIQMFLDYFIIQQARTNAHALYIHYRRFQFCMWNDLFYKLADTVEGWVYLYEREAMTLHVELPEWYQGGTV